MIAALAACSGSGTSRARPTGARSGDRPGRQRTVAFPPEAATECHPGGDWSKVPLAIPVTTGQAPAPQGYMRREEFCGSYHGLNAPIPVYAQDLVALVGHMYTNRGFVSVSTDPRTVPCFNNGFRASTKPDGTVVTSRGGQTCDPPYEAP